jgi:hypothetical protein
MNAPHASSCAPRHGEGTLGLGQLTRSASVFPQRVRRGIVVGELVRFIAHLLQIVNKRLQSVRVATVGSQDSPCARVQRARVFPIWVPNAFGSPKNRALALPTRH